MREKIALFCNLNEIANPEQYQLFADVIANNKYEACVVYNTYDFLIQGIWDLYNGVIDDELFFQIGDVTSQRNIKKQRPHLDAVEDILKNIGSATIYVVDNLAKIAYTHVYGSWDNVEKKLIEKGSAIYVI